MRAKTTIIMAALTLATAIWAQDVAEIFNELTAKTVSAPAPAQEPAQEPALGITVSQPMTAETKPAAEEPVPAVVVVEEMTPAASADALETVAVVPEKTGQGAIKGGLISLNIKGAELNSIIRLFTELSGANIIVPELEAAAGASKVDVNLKNVEWKPALQAILDGQGLELYEKIPGAAVYGVRKKLPAAEAIKTTRTFSFRHADIKQAEDVMKGIVADRGQVYAYPHGNSIVVKTTQEIMDDVAQIAERIDQPRKQVLIEARILELTDDVTKDHGVNWASDKGLLNRALSLGGYNVSNSSLVDLTSGYKDNFNTLTMNAGQVSVLLSALDQMADVQTVSSPKVIVANGEKATIKIIRKEPVIISTPTFGGTDGALQSIVYNQDPDGIDPLTGKKRYATYDYGIMLDVTPTIYSEENIGVHIIPTISRRTVDPVILSLSANDEDSPKQTFPVIDEKRVDTTFMLADKQTAVIGGLTETSKQETQKKVPVLSSIPLIRHLFTYTYTKDVQLENVIFVTVSLEDGKNFDMDKAVQTSRLTRKQLIRDDNNQILDDQAIESFKGIDQKRVNDEVKRLEKKKK